MAAGRANPVLLAGILVLSVLLGAGLFLVFDTDAATQGQDGVDTESYPIGPEKPTPLNVPNVDEYAVAYEQRLFYNDLLASQNHTLAQTERVISNCYVRSLSDGDGGRFRVELACRGGIADTASHLNQMRLRTRLHTE